MQGLSYESCSNNKEQQQEFGQFYTPKDLAIKMAKMLKIKRGGKILDACCGKGNLFVAVLEIYPFIEMCDLYGVDIDSEAIRFCIEKFPGGNFQMGNCLDDDISDDDFWKKDPFESYQDYLKRHPKSWKSTFGKTK